MRESEREHKPDYGSGCGMEIAAVWWIIELLGEARRKEKERKKGRAVDPRRGIY